MRIGTVIVLFLLLATVLSLILVSGCTIAEEKQQGLLATQKTTTRITLSGVEKETKTCPFWNRDC